MPIIIDAKGEMTTALPPRVRRSEAVNEIISDRPSFLVRWGLSVFLLVLVGITCLSWFIRYPDIIAAKAKLTSLNAPKAIVTKAGGKLVALNIKEDDKVEAGTIIGAMESIGNPRQVLQLDSMVVSLTQLVEANTTSNLKQFTQIKYAQLGELQTAYQTFVQALLTYCNYTPGGFFVNKRYLLITDKGRLQNLKSKLEAQKILSEQDLVLEQKTMEAQEQLLKDKVISPLEYRNEKSKLLSKLLSLPPADAGIISNAGQQTDKQKEMMELDNQIIQQKMIFIQALSTFKNAVEDWKNKFLLIAPIKGKVAFATFLQIAQQLQSGQTICYINPENSSYYAEMYIPQNNFGKVSTGQKVLLNFQAFPNQEYGSLVGKIDFISRIPSDSGYLAKVILTGGLTTNYNKNIQFRDGLTATSQIITKDMRLLQRMYFTLMKNVEQQ
jgi:multidrug efflux pump subunit AcrA (membrane-fusion protein)